MGEDWRSRNVFTRTAGNVYEGSGAKTAVAFADSSTANSNLRLLPGAAGAAIDFGRDIAVNKVIDPLAGKAVKSVSSYFMDQKLPAITFYDSETTSYPTKIGWKFQPSPTNGPIPVRMIELDTGNLVNIGTWNRHRDVYCILSHTWRGQEIEYSFFQGVQEKKTKQKKLKKLRDQIYNNPNASEHLKAVADFQLSEYTYLEPKKDGPAHPPPESDVASVIAECDEEINILEAYFKPSSIPELLEDRVLAGLLANAIKTRTAISGESLKIHQWQGSDEFNNIVEFLKNETFITQFRELLEEPLQNENSRPETSSECISEAAQEITNDSNRKSDDSIDVTSSLKGLPIGAVQQLLNDYLDESITSLEGKSRECVITDIESRIRQAIESTDNSEVSYFFGKLKTTLEKRRSAEKIVESLRVGRELFEKHWPRYSDKKKYNRYIWNDTCCINKSIVGEHQESLAMMGEWYSNAEFCVVHVDTTPDETTPWDPLDTWRAFRENNPFNPTPQTFEEIANPKWSTRGWTLQELALSRDVFFLNNIWQTLEPVGCPSFVPSTPPRPGDLNDKCPWCTYPKIWHDETHPRYTEAFITNVLHTKNSELQPLTLPFERHAAIFKGAVAKFSNVPPAEVCRGAARSKLPAYEILSLASERRTTVETDHVYSLMGMAGKVKFPAFHAEGLSKALARLLDEIVINSNDVSVFNWVGAEFGSPIAGRSLYPVSHMAYRKIKSEEARKGEEGFIAAGRTLDTVNDSEEADEESNPKETTPVASKKCDGTDKKKRAEADRKAAILFKNYKLLESIMDGAQLYIKNNNKDVIAMLQASLEAILRQIENKPLDGLNHENVLSIGKIIRTVTDHFHLLKDGLETKQRSSNVPSPLQTDPPQKSASYPISPSPPLPNHPSSPPLARAETPAHTKGKSTKWSIKTPSVSFTKPTLGWMSSETSAPLMPSTPKPRSTTESAASESPPTPSSSVESSTLAKQMKAKSSGVGQLFSSLAGSSSDEKNDVATYLKLAVEDILAKKLTKNVNDKGANRKDVNHRSLETLINEVQKTMETISEKQAFYRDKEVKDKDVDERDDDNPEAALIRMISPNPIIVNSSGLDVVVDIQRVKVSFGSEKKVKKLRNKIADARSPSDLISGKCTLSTGLAVLKVNFSATAAQLAKQLDVCDVINTVHLSPRRTTAAAEAKKSDDEKKMEDTGLFSILPTSLPSLILPTSLPSPFAAPEERAAAEATQAELRKQQQEEARTAEAHRLRASRILRTLRFVQQPDITLLAGEWVLARFSGAPGAKWFLCLFELGLTHEFYGTRIPCSAIDFGRAAPEEDLREYWGDYVRVKKTGLCYLLRTMIDKKKSLMDAEEAKKAFRTKTQEIKVQAEEALAEMATPVSEKEQQPEISVSELNMQENVGMERDVVSEMKEAVVDLGISKLEHWVHKAEARWYEFEEIQRQRLLRDDSLKSANIPEHLHAAVLSLDENTTLPSMYHAARQIHFF